MLYLHIKRGANLPSHTGDPQLHSREGGNSCERDVWIPPYHPVTRGRMGSSVLLPDGTDFGALSCSIPLFDESVVCYRFLDSTGDSIKIASQELSWDVSASSPQKFECTAPRAMSTIGQLLAKERPAEGWGEKARTISVGSAEVLLDFISTRAIWGIFEFATWVLFCVRQFLLHSLQLGSLMTISFFSYSWESGKLHILGNICLYICVLVYHGRSRRLWRKLKLMRVSPTQISGTLFLSVRSGMRYYSSLLILVLLSYSLLLLVRIGTSPEIW